MVWWRSTLLLAMLVLLPVRIECKPDDEIDEDNTDEESDNTDDDDDEDGEEIPAEKTADVDLGRGGHSLMPTTTTITATRTTIRRPLECYVCAYKADAPIKSCLDPTKFRVHTMTCHSAEEKCFTMVTTKAGSLQSVVRGCRSDCVASANTTCCETNRCNSYNFPMPIINRRSLVANKETKMIPTTVLFFVTILLVLQTVVKVAFV